MSALWPRKPALGSWLYSFSFLKFPSGEHPLSLEKKYDRVVVDPSHLYRLKQFTHVMINLHHKIGIGVHFAGTFKKELREQWAYAGRAMAGTGKKGLPDLDWGARSLTYSMPFPNRCGSTFIYFEVRADGPLAIPAIRVFFFSHTFFPIR